MQPSQLPGGAIHPHEPFVGPAVWRRPDLTPDDWLVRLDPAALAEIDRIAGSLDPAAIEVERLDHADFDCPATAALMAKVMERLATGRGVAVLERLPFERWSEPVASAIAWLLCDFIAPPVNQKWTGTRMYAVRDTGAQLGYGVRRSLTNLRQDLHTDGPWLKHTPHYMGLACLRQAAEGGDSQIASLAAAHEQMRGLRPDLLERLYQPLFWDRQAEHPPGAVPANWLPLFERGEQGLKVRYYDDYVRNGYRLMERPLDEPAEQALALLQSILEAPENRLEFRLAQGQILFLNNHLVAHGRSAFSNAAGERLLLRFWLRRGGIGFETEPSEPG